MVATSSAHTHTHTHKQYNFVSNAVLANMRPSSKVFAALSHRNSSNKTTEHNSSTEHITETLINVNKRNVVFVNNGVPVNLTLPPPPFPYLTTHVYTSAALGPVLINRVALL
jgi:hypothetical protein